MDTCLSACPSPAIMWLICAYLQRVLLRERSPPSPLPISFSAPPARAAIWPPHARRVAAEPNPGSRDRRPPKRRRPPRCLEQLHERWRAAPAGRNFHPSYVALRCPLARPKGAGDRGVSPNMITHNNNRSSADTRGGRTIWSPRCNAHARHLQAHPLSTWQFRNCYI